MGAAKLHGGLWPEDTSLERRVILVTQGKTLRKKERELYRSS